MLVKPSVAEARHSTGRLVVVVMEGITLALRVVEWMMMHSPMSNN